MHPKDAHDADFAEAMNLWVTITGEDAAAHSIEMNRWSVKGMHESLFEALRLDPTDATAFLMLEGFRRDYFRQRVFSLTELVENPVKTAAYVGEVARLKAMLEAPTIVAIGDAFAESLRAGAMAYGAYDEAVAAEIADRFSIGLLRRDALRSMGELRLDQFLSGEPEAEGYKPVHARDVHQFWNVNSLLRSACDMPSGVSLNLIRDPDAFQSYFVFAVRNGGNLFLLSDYPERAHPLARHMSRRPERALDRRAARNWFPYDLLGLAYRDDGEPYVIPDLHAGGLIPYQRQAFPLKPVMELDPKERLWTLMMFDLIVRDFWHLGRTAPELSYTGEMVRVEGALSTAAERANLPVVAYRGLSAKPLTVKDVNASAAAYKEPVRPGDPDGSHNAWLEERYAARVGDAVLNLTGVEGAGYRLADVSADPGTAMVIAAKPGRRMEDGPGYVLRAYDPTSFGSAERVLADRVFVARHNMAVAIQKMADEEFRDRKAEILEWYSTKVRANVPSLVRDAVRRTAWRLEKGPQDLWVFEGDERVAGKSRRSIMETHDTGSKESRPHNSDYAPCISVRGGWDRNGTAGGGFPLCAVDGTRARIEVTFMPRNAHDLCRLAGVHRGELPDVLRNWWADPVHEGNHILDRIDPMTWALRDPWCKLPLGVRLHLSRKTMAAAGWDPSSSGTSFL